MTLGHDGHTITCASCRVPLRAALVSSWSMELGHSSMLVGEVESEYVRCENCGADLGSLDEVQRMYERMMGQSPEYSPLGAAQTLAADLRAGGANIPFSMERV